MRDELQHQIALLLERQPDVFGAGGHQFEINETLSASDVEAFERRHGILLPEDYRWFLLNVGNGGAGPYYGVFPLGVMDDGHGFLSWEEGDSMVGSLSEAFPHSEPWNDLTGQPEDDLADNEEAEYEAQLDAFEEVYFSPQITQGAIPICHLGCALRVWLVVTGPERGHLWLDKRADRGGLEPLGGLGAERISFLEWYRSWVDASLLEPPTAETVEEASERATPEPPGDEESFMVRLRNWWRA